MKTRLPAALALLLALAAPWGAQMAAQATATASWDPGQLELTREDLTRLMAEYEQVTGSSAYSGSVREQARRDVAAIRERLDAGDFRVGDRVVLRVEGYPEFPDTLLVEPGPRVSLPTLGTISLHGVLRSELQAHLTEEIGRYIRNPNLEARSLIRISIQGEVGSPGFYVVPANALLSDILMLAGGMSGDANLRSMRIERGTQRIWEGEVLQEMLVEGRTLDQLNVRAGDQIVVPERRGSVLAEVGRFALMAVIPALIAALLI